MREQEALLLQQSVACSLELATGGFDTEVTVKRSVSEILVLLLVECMLHISDFFVFFAPQQPLTWSLLAYIPLSHKITSPGKAVGLEM